MLVVTLLLMQILSVIFASILHFKGEYYISNLFSFIGIALCSVIIFLN